MENKELKERFIDEKTGIEYVRQGDYYIPNLVLPKQKKIHLNKYGRMRLNYLKEYKKAEYTIMFMENTLFYHLKLKCYIVVELKAREFEPTDAGQLNFYLSAVDDLVKDKDDNATIGLLLCKGKDNFTAEYALKDINKPIGVSKYKLLEDMPEYLQSQLPRAEDIELHIKDVEEIEEQEDN